MRSATFAEMQRATPRRGIMHGSPILSPLNCTNSGGRPSMNLHSRTSDAPYRHYPLASTIISLHNLVAIKARSRVEENYCRRNRGRCFCEQLVGCRNVITTIFIITIGNRCCSRRNAPRDRKQYVKGHHHRTSCLRRVQCFRVQYCQRSRRVAGVIAPSSRDDPRLHQQLLLRRCQPRW